MDSMFRKGLIMEDGVEDMNIIHPYFYPTGNIPMAKPETRPIWTDATDAVKGNMD